MRDDGSCHLCAREAQCPRVHGTDEKGLQAFGALVGTTGTSLLRRCVAVGAKVLVVSDDVVFWLLRECNVSTVSWKNGRRSMTNHAERLLGFEAMNELFGANGQPTVPNSMCVTARDLVMTAGHIAR